MSNIGSGKEIRCEDNNVATHFGAERVGRWVLGISRGSVVATDV